MGSAPDPKRLLEQVMAVGLALGSEHDLQTLLELTLTGAREITRAEAGTLFLRDDDVLKFEIVQNDVLAQRLGEAEAVRRVRSASLGLADPSLAGHVARTGETLNIADAYVIPPDAPYRFNRSFDAHTQYRTRSVLVVPIQEPSRRIVGVLQLINARDDDGEITAFDPAYENILRLVTSHAAVMIRNERLEEMSFKDGLTDAYNRRYLMLRLREEERRFERGHDPFSLVLFDVDHFKNVNDQSGHGAGDAVLTEVTQLLMNQSRQYTIVARYGGDEFAAFLPATSKGGAASYAERVRRIVERYPFAYGRVTVSIGVATVPDDAATVDALIQAADAALYTAKRLGRNMVASAGDAVTAAETRTVVSEPAGGNESFSPVARG